jgi:gliding motility-associated-like protein
LNAGLQVIGDTVCSNSSVANVTVLGTKKDQIYAAYWNGNFLAKDTVRKDGDFTLQVPVNGLKLLNKINLTASNSGCGTIALKDSANIVVSPLPDSSLAVSDDVVCRNSVSATVIVSGSKKGETYIAYLNGLTPLDTVLSGGTPTTLSIPVNSLASGVNNIVVRASIKGCKTVSLKDTSHVVVNILPSDTLKVIGDTVCSGKDFAHVSVKGTSKEDVFQAYDANNQVLGQPQKSLGGTVILNIPVFGTLGKGVYSITVKATIQGCDTITLRNKATVLINDAPKPTLPVIGDTVCVNSDTAFVSILETKLGESYVARIGGVTISDSVISLGGAVRLKVPVNKLPKDTSSITIFTNVIGCGEAPLLNQALILIHHLPADTLTVKGDTICENASEAIVKISNTGKDITYSAWLNKKQVGASVKSAGGDVFLRLPISELSLDTNRIGFLASIYGCADVPLKDSALVIVNRKPTETLSVEGSTICSSEDTATVTILKSNKGAVYQAFLNGKFLSTPSLGTGSDLVLKIPTSKLPFDTNLVSIAVDVNKCSIDTLINKAKVIVNRLPSDTLRTVGSTICKNSGDATVTVYNSQKHVGYQAFIDNDSVGNVVIGTGGTIILPVLSSKLKEGVNKVVVKTSLEKCNVITLKDTAIVIFNDNTYSDSTGVEGSSVCWGEDGYARLSHTKPGYTYTLYLGGSFTSFNVVGTGQSDVLLVPANFLNAGINPISFSVSVASCSPTFLKDTDTIFVLRNRNFAIQGDDWLCYNDTGNYTTNGMPGALSYVWSVGNKSSILSGQGTTNLSVKFDSISSYVKVFPVGDFGVCRNDSAFESVTINAPVTGIGKIRGKDTVCANEIDTIQVYNQKGADRYKWKLPAGVEVLDTLATDTIGNSDSLVVRYTRAGIDTIKAYVHSYCSQTYVDSVMKVVRVLGQPIAEANEYPIPDVASFDNGMALNGTGSTYGDTISYKWYTAKGVEAQIANPTTLNNAYLTTKANEVKVYLTVTNVHGSCPATDSAIIQFKLKLVIPNVFSPNNDGNHDNWEIKNLGRLYPNAVVEIFNQWGSFIWKSSPGYPQPWDGTRNGEQMPVATYYYILDYKDGTKPIASSITIVR